MNGSKPCRPAGQEPTPHRKIQAPEPSPLTFPLTPTLSPGERAQRAGTAGYSPNPGFGGAPLDRSRPEFWGALVLAPEAPQVLPLPACPP
jgi:hypothetical protein